MCFHFQALRSFKVTVSVDPKFHPKIIGRKGAVISQIRKDHDVNIQFPDKGDEDQVGAFIGFMENRWNAPRSSCVCLEPHAGPDRDLWV